MAYEEMCQRHALDNALAEAGIGLFKTSPTPAAGCTTCWPAACTPTSPTYSSWLNQVERWFAYLTEDLLRRGDHRSVPALEKDIRAWVKAWNDNPKPFIWTKTAEQILERLGRLIQRINGAGH
jgi:hypothetical protein